MSRRLISTLLLLFVSLSVHSATNWKEGKHYFAITPPKPNMLDNGIVEVTEIFSYGCPACNSFYPIAEKLRISLPNNVQFNYLPASFLPAEDWPMFQRAYCTAQVLGLVDSTHKEMFDAIWKTGELGIVDPKTQRMKKVLPTIEDAAKFYNRVTGVPVEKFLATAKSFGINTATKRADQLIKAYHVNSTPTIVINGKYRLTAQSAGGYDQLIELTNWLVAKESLEK